MFNNAPTEIFKFQSTINKMIEEDGLSNSDQLLEVSKQFDLLLAQVMGEQAFKKKEND